MPEKPPTWIPTVITGGRVDTNESEESFLYGEGEAFPVILHPSVSDSERLLEFVVEKGIVSEAIIDSSIPSVYDTYDLTHASYIKLHSDLRRFCFAVPPDQRDLEAIHSLARALHKILHTEIPAGDKYVPQIPPLQEQGSDVRNAAIHLCELTRHVHQVLVKEHINVSKRTVDLFTEDQYMDTNVTLRSVYKELHESLMTMVTLLQNSKRITVDEETLVSLYIDQRALVQAIENKILAEGDV